jgi:proteasome lid subunit RPN8/RPN11
VTLLLDPQVRDAVVAHAREGAPEEICGVLGGVHRPGGDAPTDDGRPSHARTARRVPNVASVPRTRYELDPAEQFRAMESVEDAGEVVVGFYHSHPRGPPRPSATDEALATWPGYSYVIVSLGGSDPEIGSWRWTGEGFERERLSVDEET